MNRNRSFQAGATVIVTALLAVAMSSVTIYGYGLSLYKWLVVPVVVYVNPNNLDLDKSAAEAAVKAGMNAWNGIAAFQFLYGGRVSDTATAIDGRNVVIFRNASNNGAVATTYSWSKAGARFDSDIVFWDGKYHFYTGSSGCLKGAFIEDIATHELGHVAGLLHSAVTTATMYSTYTYCGTWMRSLAADDIAGLRALY